MSFIKTKLFQGFSILSMFAVLLTSFSIPALAAKQGTRGYYTTVPSGTIFSVQADEEISSKDAEVGDTFSSTITEDVYVGRNLAIPSGSQILGRVTDVTRAANRGKAGAIGVKFTQIRLPNGLIRSINGSLTNSYSDTNSRYDNEGQVKGGSSTKRNAVFIGGGAGLGALIGAIAGGGKGAAIGAIIGGGAGTGGAIFTKGQEAKVKRGDNFGVVLNQSVNIPDVY